MGARGARLAGVVLVLVVAGAAAALATSHVSIPIAQPMTQNVSYSVAKLPEVVRPSALRTVDLTITTPGHVSTVAAMALPGNLAVTTTPIPRAALLTGWIPNHATFPVTWVGRDPLTGFSIVRLSQPVKPLVLAPLPANTSVTAISPVIIGPAQRPRFTWSTTTLGDPTLRA